MKPTAIAFVIVLLVTLAPGADDTSQVNDGHVRPFTGSMPLGRFDVPPFGTVLEQCSLEMSGSYAGAGMTWRRDEEKFYLVDQGFPTWTGVWRLDPRDPVGTIEEVPWEPEPIRGVSYTLPWSLAWDPDSSCFWISVDVDGQTIGGCYLLRYVWRETRWAWAGGTGDSWKIGDSRNGGGLECLWLGGAEKNPNDGLFYAVPVHTSPSELNHVVRYDPYTKTNYGRVACGDSASERGSTLIPWDSSYILTCGWNSDTYRKRDSTGYLLAEVAAEPGPSDWSLHVPRLIDPEDTVCVYCINSHSQNAFQRISTGMLWRQLPSAFDHSVRPLRILCPLGAVDSGETVTPVLVVHNGADQTAEDVDVHLLIDDEADRVLYHDSLTLTLAPRSTDTVEFSAWTATGRDSMAAIAWTYWPDDSVNWDDTITSRFLARVRRIAVIPVFPPPGDTIDEGMVYVRAQIWNLGNITMTMPVVFGIGPYWDTTWVVNLLAGGSRTVSSTNPWYAMPGVWTCTVWTPWGDTSWVFYVRGTIEHDVGVVSIDVPRGVIDTTPFYPRATIKNYGTGAESFTAHFWMEDTTSDAVVYWDSIQMILPAGLQTQQVFTQTRLTVEGLYVASCSAHLATDQDWRNNAKHVNFRVGTGCDNDIGVDAILAPTGTIDSGATITPQCVVQNYGRYPETFPVFMALPGGYLRMVNISDLGVGMPDTVTFPDWTVNVAGGTYDAVAWVPPDENPENDTCIEPITVRRRDLQMLAIVYPCCTIPADSTIIPQVRVKNNGSVIETFDIFMLICDPLRRPYYEDTVRVTGLGPGVETTVDFRPVAFTSEGWHYRSCWIEMPPRPDTLVDSFFVMRHPGIAGEAGKPRSFYLAARPSQFANATAIRFGLPRACNVDLAVFSASGRRVRTLVQDQRPPGWYCVNWHGRDDTGRALGPGIYYLRVTAGDFLASRKLVKLD